MVDQTQRPYHDALTGDATGSGMAKARNSRLAAVLGLPMLAFNDAARLSTVKVGVSRSSERPAVESLEAQSAPSLVQLQRARLTWEATRATVRQQLRTLNNEVLQFFADRAELADAKSALRRFDEVLEALDEKLIDTLDGALNETDPVQQRAMYVEARACIRDYEDFVHTSDLVAGIDANPFTKVEIRATVERSAVQLRTALA